MKLVLVIILFTLSLFIQTSFASDSDTLIEKSTLYCQDNYYDISYHATNAAISNVTATSNFEMIFDIANSKKGTITVYIPKNFLRESIPTNPIDTGAFVDGKWLNYIDASNSTHRIRTITLPDGNFALKLEAIGYPETMQNSKVNCSLVPEFGPIVLIVSLGMIFGILIQKRFRF